MVAVVLGLAERPRPTTRPTRWRSRSGRRTAERRSGSTRRAARRAGPGSVRRSRRSTRGETPYERPSARPLAERGPARARAAGAKRLTAWRAAPVIASVEGVVGAVAADSLVVEVGGIGYRVFASPAVLATAPPGGTAQALHLPPGPRGPAGAVRLPDRRGAGVLQPAAHRDRRRARRSRWRSSARARRADLQLAIMQQDQAVLVVDPGDRQEARRADHLRAQGEGRGGRGRGVRLRGRGRGRGEGEVVGALQALGYSLAEAREASRAALANPAVGTALEERVKAALRVLARD